jgi:hypothetical protein
MSPLPLPLYGHVNQKIIYIYIIYEQNTFVNNIENPNRLQSTPIRGLNRYLPTIYRIKNLKHATVHQIYIKVVNQKDTDICLRKGNLLENSLKVKPLRDSQTQEITYNRITINYTMSTLTKPLQLTILCTD